MVDPEIRRSFSALVAAAFVDGMISAQERQVLHRKATEMNVPVRLMNEIIAQGEQGKLPVAIPASRQEKERLLDDLIDIACADGRIEAPEHHLLAKFASHLGMGLPDLRARVRRRTEESQAARTPPPPRPRIEEIRLSPDPAPVVGETAPPPVPPPPPLGSPVEDIPPVTLQLIKQAIVFESEADALHYIERMMGVTRPEAERIMRSILEAFPEIKPGTRRLTRQDPR